MEWADKDKFQPPEYEGHDCTGEHKTCRRCRYWIPAPGVDRNAGLCSKDRKYRGLCPAGYTCSRWTPNSSGDGRKPASERIA